MKRPAPPSVNIDDLPGHYIRRLHQISVGVFLQELAELGITPVQYAALQTVANQPGIDQRTLARQIALDASTTGGVVDRLEQRGALERRTAPADRRARQLWLTEGGEQLLADAVPAMLSAQQLILAPLTDRQRADFMRLLRIVVDENNALSRAPSEAVR
ncbi:MAG: MarR family transcriptional regulator [Hydrogenophaga sp.]|jgi:DNA-binding MarR family transcriptional regulator|nr:MarR family transcriptional regulator [Hydrogenophaga sp.]